MAFTLESIEHRPELILDSHIEVESHGTEGEVAERFLILDSKSEAYHYFKGFLQTANPENTIYSLNYRETGGQLYVKIAEDSIHIGIGLRK